MPIPEQSFQNGKGDKPRVADFKTYQENYNLIDWGRKSLPKEEKSFKLVYRDPQDYLDMIQG